VWVSAGCGGCHVLNEVGRTGPDLNLTHPGGFARGPLTATELANLIAYIRGQ
jgi:hypothetical protein